ncbi:MAG: D-lyxose/D-mannose family sugar isomerase [Alkalispirochaetaceae bacterium]
MKRSTLNEIIRDAEAFFERFGFKLPPWARWKPEDWKKIGPDHREIVENMLGWDVTDFNLGTFEKRGLVLFTLRNGKLEKKDKPYAEKIMIVGVNQETPYHFHWQKMEDIINRGGGTLVLELSKSDKDEGLSDEPFTVQVDGVTRQFGRPGRLELNPGESVTLPPYLYHRFWAEGDRVLTGEVSMVNDDNSDNRFLEPLPRFPQIEEDEAPYRLLVSEYPSLP